MNTTANTDPWLAHNFTQAMNNARAQAPTQEQRDDAETNAEVARINREVREIMDKPAPLTGTDKLMSAFSSLPSTADQQRAFRDQMDAKRNR